jgi:hypothetical protein
MSQHVGWFLEPYCGVGINLALSTERYVKDSGNLARFAVPAHLGKPLVIPATAMPKWLISPKTRLI